MRLGVVADIHANAPALEAVLADMPPVDAIVCAGDVVGYGPMPAACVERVRSVTTTTVRGNHDRCLTRPEQFTATPMAQAGLKHAHSRLSDAQREWLTARPTTASLAGGEYLLVHSHPEYEDEYVYPETVDTLEPVLEEYAGIIFGHTHIQHKTTVNGSLVLNPGSVGQPRDGDPRAAYAVVDTDTNEATLYRVHYDIDLVYHEIAVSGLPTAAGERLFDGE